MISFLRQLAGRDSRGPPPAWPDSISSAVPSCGGLSGPPASLSSWSQGQKMFMNVASVCLPCHQALRDEDDNTGMFATVDFASSERTTWVSFVVRVFSPTPFYSRGQQGKRQISTEDFKQRANMVISGALCGNNCIAPVVASRRHLELTADKMFQE